MLHKGNHLFVLYGEIPVCYALKQPKFIAITFYLSGWRPNPLLLLPNCISSWPHAHFNDTSTHVTITGKVSGSNMEIHRVLEYEIQKIIDKFLKILIQI